MKDTSTGLEADGSSGTYHTEMKVIAFPLECIHLTAMTVGHLLGI